MAAETKKKTTARRKPAKKGAASRHSAKKPIARTGVVKSFIPEAGKEANPPSSGELVAMIYEGLPVQEFDDLKELLGVSSARLGELLGISKATLARRKQQGVLSKEESDRAIRYAQIMGVAMEVLESREHAMRWMSLPQFGLAGAIPIEYANTEVGAKEVESLLWRIEYGVLA